jgi:hypothetical protein
MTAEAKEGSEYHSVVVVLLVLLLVLALAMYL